MSPSFMIGSRASTTTSEDDAPDGGRAQRRNGESFPGAQQRGATQTVLGQHEEDDEEDDHGEGDAEVRGPGPVGRGSSRGRRCRPGRERARRRRSAKCCGAVRTWRRRWSRAPARVSTCTSSVPPLIGVMRIPARAASAPPKRPREGGQPLGTTPVQLEECRVVHHRPHGHARPRALEEHPDAHRDEHSAPEGDRLVVGHIDAEDLEFGRIAEEQLVGAGDAGVPDPRGQGDQTRA